MFAKRRLFFMMLVLSLLGSLTTLVTAQTPPADLSREQRAEIRFLQGMIDHHQMALDMAQDCLAKTENDTMRDLCQAVIDAQTPEIEQMQQWLKDWYTIEYAPMSMTSNTGAMGMMDMDMEMMGMMDEMCSEDGMMGMMNMMPDSEATPEADDMGMGMMNMMGMMQMMCEHHEKMMAGGMMGGMGGMEHGEQGGQHGQDGQHNQHEQHGQNANGFYTDPAMMMGMFAGFNRLSDTDYDIAWLESMIDHHDDALHMSQRLLRRVMNEELRDLANNIIQAQSTEIKFMEDLLTEFAQDE